MMKMFPTALLVTASVAIATPFLSTLPLSAHQLQTKSDSDVGAMIHLEPKDSPIAGKSTATWFMLKRHTGEMISPATCNCQVNVYNWRNVAIAKNLPFSLMTVGGHQSDHKAISTAITFPKPGAYTVVLSGTAKDKSFSAFELKFPVTVRP